MKDKCVLITGATKGIGWALTQRLSDMGCHVVGIARNTGDVDFPGYLYACDLADAGRTEEVLREIREKFPVDAVVNNVGIASPQPLGEIDLIMPLDDSATFDGHGAGWLVYGPGSAHPPTVAQGRALVLYLLPQGQIEFTR